MMNNKKQTKTTIKKPSIRRKKVKEIRDVETMITRADLEEMDIFPKDVSPEDFFRGLQMWAFHELERSKGIQERIDYPDLYELCKSLYNVAALMEHRCAAVQILCMLMYAIGLPKPVIQAFFDKNINQKDDCKSCRNCFERRDSVPTIVYMQELSNTLH